MNRHCYRSCRPTFRDCLLQAAACWIWRLERCCRLADPARYRGNSPTSGLLVLIDGHPQYMGLMGHPIADAYQTVLAEKVEVVRGPASVIYGSNAMGGVINIVTREAEEGTKTHLRSSYGSFNTTTNEITNQTRIGGFGSTVSAFYNRTDGHRRDMGFEQMGGLVKLSYEMSPAWRWVPT